MKHLDLFSGIGGFALAAKWCGMETVAFCEIEPFCQQLLKQHWPGVPIYGDIRKLDAIQFQTGEIDIITGGFPCQPFSCAGQRKGAADDRHLWPEIFRLIAQTRPAWVVGENVPGIIGVELDHCLFDLEAEGYAWQTFIIPACAVDAPHRRERAWIVAHDQGNGRGPGRAWGSDSSGQRKREQTFSIVANTANEGRNAERGASKTLSEPETIQRSPGCGSPMADSESQPMGCAGQPRQGPYTWQPEPGVG